MLKIEINNTAAANLPSRTIIKRFEKFLLARQIKNAEISLAFVDKKTMRRLNHSYRGLDQPTDVLSFSYRYKNGMLDGEIVICCQIAQEQAKKFGHSFESEIIRLLAHGFLHLIGYDHRTTKEARKMRRLEEKIIKPSLCLA